MVENEFKRKGKAIRTDGPQMTRSEALRTMGAYAAGMTFFGGSPGNPDLSESGEEMVSGKIPDDPVLAKAIAELEYLTPADKFIVQRRGNPVLTEIPEEKLPALGLTRDTWKLEVVPDPESNSELGNPFSRERGTSISWSDLMGFARRNTVRYLHLLTCTNSGRPYGMGLWEGVPLRDILWKAEPGKNIRRIFFYGYHNDDPKQIFQASLPVNRILEEGPGELPVILCYRLNGKFLSQANGGPVRVIVPGFYGNRSIKWLRKILVTNKFQANDTYAEWNNDVESPVKTCARFIKVPEKAKSGTKFAFTGLAQVGESGLSRVQYRIDEAGVSMPDGDPYLASVKWKDAFILPPPVKWGSDLPGGKLPELMQFDRGTGKPYTWPLPNTMVHWAGLEKIDKAGEYEVRCRTTDANGIPQPMPRPFGRSGINVIEVTRLTVV